VKPYLFFVAILGYLLACWAMFLLFDLNNVWESRGLISLRFSQYELSFLWLFFERGPTEILQWICNSLSLLICLYLYRCHKREGNLALSKTFALGSLGFALMLLEDFGNVRFWVSDYVALQLVQGKDGVHLYEVLNIVAVTHTFLYSILGLILTCFLFRIYLELKRVRGALAFMLSGYIFYGAAAAGSATAHFGSWYTRTGTMLLGGYYESLNEAFLRHPLEFMPDAPLGFWIMDLLVEESLELLGAAAITTALLLFLTGREQHEKV